MDNEITSLISSLCSLFGVTQFTSVQNPADRVGLRCVLQENSPSSPEEPTSWGGHHVSRQLSSKLKMPSVLGRWDRFLLLFVSWLTSTLWLVLCPFSVGWRTLSSSSFSPCRATWCCNQAASYSSLRSAERAEAFKCLAVRHLLQSLK